MSNLVGNPNCWFSEAHAQAQNVPHNLGRPPIHNYRGRSRRGRHRSTLPTPSPGPSKSLHVYASSQSPHGKAARLLKVKI